MDPKSYLDRYTNLAVIHPGTGLPVAGGVTGYGSGWGNEKHCNRVEVGKKCQKEYNSYFVPALRMAHHGNPNTPAGSSFSFDQRAVANFDPTEQFFVSSFVRAFNGKGSPDEIADTLRIALAIGRIGFGSDANGMPAARSSLADYVRDFITLDCNGLVGNYYGLDPNFSPSSYALPSRKRSSLTEVSVGDAVVTVTSDGTCEHIALIQEWRSAGNGSAWIKIVEWGESGDETKHYTGDAPRLVQVQSGPNPAFGVGFSTDLSKFRYVFAPPPTNDSRGWGFGGNPSL